MLAHKLGKSDSVSSSLASLYVAKNEPDQALLWHNRALKNNCMYAKTRNENVLEEIRKLKELNKDLKANIDDEKYNLCKEFIRTMNLEADKKLSPFMISKEISKYDHKMLKDYALNKGSITASTMLKAQLSFFEALYMLENEKYREQIEKFVSLISKAYETDSLVCTMPIHLYDKVVKILETFITNNKNAELDRQARIALMFFNQSIEFIAMSLRKYPNTKSMLQLRGCLYAFKAKWPESLKDFEAISKLDPNCFENILNYASTLYQMGRYKQALVEFKKFFTLSPKDHRKLPHAYYTVASIHLLKDQKMSREFYEKGLTSESDQLPCFLPYESNIKLHMSSCFKDLCKKQEKKTNVASTTQTTINEHIREKVARDYRRISLITEHREYRNSIREKAQLKNCIVSQITTVPTKKQALESIIGLKPVYLRDIDFTKDHVLKSSVLTLKVIDSPLVAISTSMIAVDDNNVAERVTIYNLKEDHKKIEEMFQIGCQFSIINPYVRMALDGI